MTDTVKLECAIVTAGKKKKDIAEFLGITAYSLYKKIHNKVEFKATEIAALTDFLNIPIESRDSIFFAN